MLNIAIPDRADILKLEDRLKCIRDDVNNVAAMSSMEVKAYAKDVMLAEVQGG